MFEKVTRAYYVLSVVGTAAHCLFWIEFTTPLLNVIWTLSVPVGGTVVEMVRAHPRAIEEPGVDCWRTLHRNACAAVALYALTLPGIFFLSGNLDAPARPMSGYWVCLLPLFPYGVFPPLFSLPRAFIAGSSVTARVAAGLLGLALLVPTACMTGVIAIGAMFFWGDSDPLEAEEVLVAPSGLWVARHELRTGPGGVFADALGRVWVEPRGLPIRRLVYRYSCDRHPGELPAGVARWEESRLLTRGPGEASGSRVGWPTLW